MSASTLALSLFFHIGATVIWIGGLLITVILVWPEMRRVLEENVALYQLLSRLRRRFYPISNLCLVVLVTTGLFQMTASPHYNGLMQFDNEWSQVMLLKHIAIVGMVIAGVILQYGVTPSLERTSLLLERGKGDVVQWQRLRRREVMLTWVNVGLGVLVLAFSAWATAL